jgi:hypothetical protein
MERILSPEEDVPCLPTTSSDSGSLISAPVSLQETWTDSRLSI